MTDGIGTVLLASSAPSASPGQPAEPLVALLAELGEGQMTRLRGEGDVGEVRWLERPHPVAAGGSEPAMERATALYEVDLKRARVLRTRLLFRLELCRAGGRDALLMLRYHALAEPSYAPIFDRMRRSVRPLAAAPLAPKMEAP